MKVLIIAPYPKEKAPNQRFRFEQYLWFLEQNGIELTYSSFWSLKSWDIIYKNGFFLAKAIGLLSGIMRRIKLLFSAKTYTYVFIHRECLPIGPPIIEYILAKWLKKKIIYDFDDAIWLQNNSEFNNSIVRWFKHHRKVKHICKMSYKISAGNHFLANYAKEYNPNVVVIPTTIDTENYHRQIKQVKKEGLLTIGWTGTHSTLIQLALIESQLADLQKTIPFNFHIICNTDPGFKKLNYLYKDWKLETEIEDLLNFDIGVMPLMNTDWERGKCGFKALQYMSLGIACVASNVGANSNIFTHGLDGYLVDPNRLDDWKKYLTELLLNHELRKQLGQDGRKTVEAHYSVKSNLNNYLRLFDKSSK